MSLTYLLIITLYTEKVVICLSNLSVLHSSLKEAHLSIKMKLEKNIYSFMSFLLLQCPHFQNRLHCLHNQSSLEHFLWKRLQSVWHVLVAAKGTFLLQHLTMRRKYKLSKYLETVIWKKVSRGGGVRGDGGGGGG